LGLAIALTAGPCATHAATASGAFAVRGIGAENCKDITSAAQGKQGQELLQTATSWIAGYVSQFDRSNPNTYEAIPIVDNAVLGRLAITLCRANSDALFETVTASLIRSFAPGALSEESPVVELKSGANSAKVRKAVFRLVQQELIKAGFLPAGSADGDYGPRSGEALAKYQKAQGITATGVPDPETLVHLFAMGKKASDSGKK
jgi:hypothetical protein